MHTGTFIARSDRDETGPPREAAVPAMANLGFAIGRPSGEGPWMAFAAYS
jgi:hypothetical protein